MTTRTNWPALRPSNPLFNSRRGRILLENLTAYAFLFPAMLLIFVFGIFPVAFAFFVSLHRWRRFPEEYRGLDQYVEALGSFAYILFFWLAIGLIIYAAYSLLRLRRAARDDGRALMMIIPAAFITAAMFTFTRWFFLLLPEVLNVPVRLRGQEITRTAFINEFFNSFNFPHVLTAANQFWLAIIAAVVVWFIVQTLIKMPDSGHAVGLAFIVFSSLGAGILLLRLTLNEINLAITEARTADESLPIWTHIILISAGAALLFAAYALWRQAAKADDNRRFFIFSGLVVLLMIGGYALITQLPVALAAADEDVMRGFSIAIMYSLGTVPFQLVIGLGLAVLLFQNIKGKSLFRVVYFLPYITPFVATSLIFTLLFSHRSGSPINQLMGTFGIEPQTWLLEPRGIFRLILGESLPRFLEGPGLALIVIMIYSIWTYAGYNTVIFLAGLGNIPREMYEAAKIDGAGGWASFRFITLPLLSPTTFFLVLVSTIGTFQAFTQIWLMRKPGALDAVDTINITIFETIRDSNPDYAYGSAMAFVLFAVILILTLVQNRIAQRRVFYG